jgi:hypothetical protein
MEGLINRLKLVKRQMYGRAGFALLRARVIPPALAAQGQQALASGQPLATQSCERIRGLLHVTRSADEPVSHVF